MNGKNRLAAKLDEAEWDFSEIPNSQSKPGFFYEYARSCPAMVRKVEKYRGYFQQHRCIIPSGKILQADMTLRDIVNDYFFELIVWLFKQEQFPSIPFCKLDQRYYMLGLADSTLSFWTTAGIARLEMREKPSGVYEIIKGGRWNAPLETISFIGINWACTDEELIEAFRRQLGTNRPKDFPKSKYRLHRRAFQGLHLPFTNSSALVWLGVWRRKKNIDWAQYSDFYAPENGIEINTLQEQCRKAEEILRWFNAGGTLESDRGGRKLCLVPIKK